MHQDVCKMFFYYTSIIMNLKFNNILQIVDPKRMTWEMINDKNELDESKVKYQKHTNYIIQEFEQIKKEVIK